MVEAITTETAEAPPKQPRRTIPCDRANIFSKLSFWYSLPLLAIAKDRTLAEDDLWDVVEVLFNFYFQFLFTIFILNFYSQFLFLFFFSFLSLKCTNSLCYTERFFQRN